MNQAMPALVIIDMQQGMRSPSAGPRNNPQAEANIAHLLTAWREAGATVVFVRHMSRTAGSLFWPGQPGAQFQPELAPFDHEYVMEKNVPDAFANSGLERWLRVRGLERLVITGVSTNNSVEASARSAGCLGFAACVVADACYAYDKTDYAGVHHSAAEVHAMALANLQGEYVQVVDTDQAIRLLAAHESNDAA